MSLASKCAHCTVPGEAQLGGKPLCAQKNITVLIEESRKDFRKRLCITNLKGESLPCWESRWIIPVLSVYTEQLHKVISKHDARSEKPTWVVNRSPET